MLWFALSLYCTRLSIPSFKAVCIPLMALNTAEYNTDIPIIFGTLNLFVDLLNNLIFFMRLLNCLDRLLNKPVVEFFKLVPVKPDKNGILFNLLISAFNVFIFFSTTSMSYSNPLNVELPFLPPV